MNNILKSLLSICMITFLAGCGETADQDQMAHEQSEQGQAAQNQLAPNMNVKEILAIAEKTYIAAQEREHAWTVTAKHIKAAKASLAAGHTEAALESAQRALSTAKASLHQAERESVAWKERALKTSS